MYTLMTNAVKHRRIISIVIMTMFALTGLVGTVFGTAQDINDSFIALAKNIKNFGLVMCIVCSLYVGIMFMMSAVTPKLRDQAKAGLWGIAFGVVVLIFSNSIADIIAEFLNKSSEVTSTPSAGQVN